ncbi:MAG: hypothetical protein OEZ43_10240 [Gammaproteobacteria bacterium]|nr:hypothetical protein [Gammaproteobacteria bacterium]
MYVRVTLFSLALFSLASCGGGQPPTGPVGDTTVKCDTLQEIEAPKNNITSPVILSSGCYRIRNHLYVAAGGSLNIAPNTVIKFDADAALTLNGGDLFASGEPNNPIKFTGMIDQAGYWQGIRFHHQGTGSSFIRNAIIQYAGGKPFDAPAGVSTSVVVSGPADMEDMQVQPFVSLSNNRIEYSGGLGVYIGKHSFITEFRNNLIHEGRDAPLSVDAAKLNLVETSNQMKNNFYDYIVVTGDKLGDPDIRVTSQFAYWPKHQGTSYFVNELIKVYTNLTIEPGVTVRFDDGAGLAVLGERASFSARGNKNQPIVLTSATSTPGGWRGVTIDGSSSESNQLDYVRLEYGGKQILNSYKEVVNTTGLHVLGSNVDSITMLKVSNSEFSFSDGYGIILESKGNLLNFENNRIFGNAKGAMILPLSKANTVSLTSNLEGNGNDHILITPSVLQSDQTLDHWTAANIRYRSMSDIRIEGRATIDAGVTIEIAPRKLFLVRGQSSQLQAKGSSNNPITFTRIENYGDGISFPQAWSGIRFRNSDDRKNLLDNVVVKYGGEMSDYIGIQSVNNAANITVEPERSNSTVQSYVKIQNSEITDSIGYGIWVSENSEAVIDQNTTRVLGNALNPICHYPCN